MLAGPQRHICGSHTIQIPVVKPSRCRKKDPFAVVASKQHLAGKGAAAAALSPDRPPQCLLAVHRSLAAQPIHDAGNGRMVVPLLEPTADDLPFAVALELHRHSSSSCTLPAMPASAERSSYQLQYVLQGDAQLIQDGVPLGSVSAGDSLLMTSGTAQCQTANGAGNGALDWHFTTLTLVLGVHQNSDSEDSDDGSPQPGRAIVDTDVAQQVADSWQSYPVVGTLSGETVQQIVASAQLNAQQAVQHAGGGDRSGLPADAGGTAASSERPQLLSDDKHDSEAVVQAVHQDSSADAADSEFNTAWTAIVGSLLSRIPKALDGLSGRLDRLQLRRTLRHLETSFASQTSVEADAEQLEASFQLASRSSGGSGSSTDSSGSGTDGTSWNGSAATAAQEQQQRQRQPVHRRQLRDLTAFQLPGQTNRLALVFNPLDANLGIGFTFGLEIFEKDHRTPPHVHEAAHELFFILSGSGTAFCDGHRFGIGPGDVLVFPPTSVHGIDNGPEERLFTLELMLPNEMFAELVTRGLMTGGLSDEDLCALVAEECGYRQQSTTVV